VEPFSTEYFSILTYVSAASVQIFLYCWFGQQVEARVSQKQLQIDWNIFYLIVKYRKR
jgi:hypothetical protein